MQTILYFLVFFQANDESKNGNIKNTNVTAFWEKLFVTLFSNL